MSESEEKMKDELSVGFVLWFDPNKNYGVVTKVGTNLTFGFSKNNAAALNAAGDGPEFDPYTTATIEDPEKGQRLKFMDGGLGSRSGKPKVKYWCFEDAWLETEHAIVERKRKQAIEKVLLEHERLACNPRFRMFEQTEHIEAGLDPKMRGVFEGTKAEMLARFPIAKKYDPAVTGEFISGTKYVRTYEREVAKGWEKCDDPRKLKLPISFTAVLQLFAICDFDCLKDRAFGDEEFGWTLNGQSVAHGYYHRVAGKPTYTVSLSQFRDFADTAFEGEKAQALYDAGGKTRRVDYNDQGE